MIVIRVATGNIVEMESEPDKKGEWGGGNTTHQEYEIKVGSPG